MLPCFVFTLVLSAALLFSVQPLCGRLVLPLLGGTPAVWTTCMLFFQGMLLLGYLYAHRLSARLPLRRQLALHLSLAALGLLQLPVALPRLPAPGGSPALWLLLLLLRTVALPLLLTATTAPLLQRWFSASDHRSARDPYFLYAASNLGSLAALVAYPLLLEPRVPLGLQGRLWSWGYLLLIFAIAICGALALRRQAPAMASDPAPPAPQPAQGPALPWRLLALSFVPSSLMLGVTTHLATDIAAVPLLWVLPLGLYLLSFIIAFARVPPLVHDLLVRVQPLLVLGLVFLGVLRSTESTLMLPFHLVVFFVISIVCHGELARRRPAPAGLTAFYLWLSVGGALGGLFNALLAPLLFSRILEYPLVLVLACALLPSPRAGASQGRSVLSMSLPLLVGLLCAGLTWAVFSLRPQLIALGQALHLDAERALTSLVYALPLVLCYTFLGSAVRFGLGVGAVILAALLASDLQSPVLRRERSFFGVLTVQVDKRSGLHHLLHGTTLHGKQWPEGPRRREPLSYFHRQGPVGDVFATYGAGRRDVGLVGLGAGTLCAYGEKGQRFTFYEIDPAVVRIAQDPRLFTYLSDCLAEVRVVLGDARRELSAAQDGAHELLLLDAFSSDAIPVHLLTQEAFALYLRKLAPGGILAVHISNRYFQLAPVIGRLAEDGGLAALRKVDPGDRAQHRDRSVWVVLARSRADLVPLEARGGWAPPPVGDRLFTDDFADPLSALSWR